VPAPEFAPTLADQLADAQALRTDAQHRGWTSEVERHSRVVERLQEHLGRLDITPDPDQLAPIPMAGQSSGVNREIGRR
jgi:hypothetical protein